jgi:hypothetical protein
MRSPWLIDKSGPQDFKSADRIRGIVPTLRPRVFAQLHGSEFRMCPFVNLLNVASKGRWREGLTAGRAGASGCASISGWPHRGFQISGPGARYEMLRMGIADVTVSNGAADAIDPAGYSWSRVSRPVSIGKTRRSRSCPPGPNDGRPNSRISEDGAHFAFPPAGLAGKPARSKHLLFRSVFYASGDEPSRPLPRCFLLAERREPHSPPL